MMDDSTEREARLAERRQRVVETLGGAVAEMNLMSSCLDLALRGEYVEATSVSVSARGGGLTSSGCANDGVAKRSRLVAAAGTLRSRLAKARRAVARRRAFVAEVAAARRNCRLREDVGAALVAAPTRANTDACVARVRALAASGTTMGFGASQCKLGLARGGRCGDAVVFAVRFSGTRGPVAYAAAAAPRGLEADGAFRTRLAALSADLHDAVLREAIATGKSNDVPIHRILDDCASVFVSPTASVQLRLDPRGAAEAKRAPLCVFAAAARLAVARCLRSHLRARGAGDAAPPVLPGVLGLFRHVLARHRLLERLRGDPAAAVVDAAARSCRWGVVAAALLVPGAVPGDDDDDDDRDLRTLPSLVDEPEKAAKRPY